jgi:hypothetical protein
MSNQKPDGWATTSPEGEYTGNDDEIIISRIAPTANMVKEFLDDNYRTFPVCLIDPQELSRLRSIEAWAKDQRTRFLSNLEDLFSIRGDRESVLHTRIAIESYDAITAPEDKEKA